MILDTGCNRLTIFERSAPSIPLLEVDVLAIVDIECCVVVSGSRSFKAGRVRLVGTFDYVCGEERLTMMLPYDGYKRLVAVIEGILGIQNEWSASLPDACTCQSWLRSSRGVVVRGATF
jgi:hypothetical protein